MSLNHLEIEAIVSELSSKLVSSRLQKIHTHTSTSCQLIFKPRRDKKQVLFLCLTPGQTRLHLLSTKLPSLPTPSGWVMKLRKELEGMHLVQIDQKKDDRVIMLSFSRNDPQTTRILMATLFDHHAQLFLLDQQKRIIFSAIGNQASGQYPSLPDSKIKNLNIASRFPPPNPETAATNQAVYDFYSKLQIKDSLQERKRTVLKAAQTEHNQLSRRIANIQKDLSRASQAPMLFLQAQALKANLNNVTKGMSEIILTNPYEPSTEKITVHLDPARTPVENMQRLFKRASRLQSAQENIQQRIERDKTKLKELDRLKNQLSNLRSEVEFNTLKKEFSHLRLFGQKQISKKVKQTRLPYKIFHSSKGLKILVGRTAKDNHTLTFKIARGADLWLHAAGHSGAHVIVRLDANQQVDEQTLLDAATLAAQASGANPGDKCEVVYTKAKNVHTIKGAPPGLASVAKKRSIMISIEPERIKRLHRKENHRNQ